MGVQCVAHDLHTIARWPRELAAQKVDYKTSRITSFNAIIPILTIIIIMVVVVVVFVVMIVTFVIGVLFLAVS